MKTIEIPMDLAIKVFILLRQMINVKQKDLALDINEKECEDLSQILYQCMCDEQTENENVNK